MKLLFLFLLLIACTFNKGIHDDSQKYCTNENGKKQFCIEYSFKKIKKSPDIDFTAPMILPDSIVLDIVNKFNAIECDMYINKEKSVNNKCWITNVRFEGVYISAQTARNKLDRYYCFSNDSLSCKSIFEITIDDSPNESFIGSGYKFLYDYDSKKISLKGRFIK